MLPWLLLISALLTGLFIYLGAGGTAFESNALPFAAAVMVALAALYAIAMRGHHDGEKGFLRRAATAATLLIALAAGGYYLWPRFDSADVLRRLAGARGETESGAPASEAGFKSVRIRKGPDGRFVARGEINGAPAELLIDSGASAVILRQSDAERAGIDTKSLAYTVPVDTANGQTHAAAVQLRTLAIGPIRIDGLEALVAAPGSLNESLLGITFLRRLRSYEITGDFITLRE